MSLSDWARNGWLVPHRTTPQELTDLLAIVDRDLADSEASGPERRLAPQHRLQRSSSGGDCGACRIRTPREPGSTPLPRHPVPRAHDRRRSERREPPGCFSEEEELRRLRESRRDLRGRGPRDAGPGEEHRPGCSGLARQNAPRDVRLLRENRERGLAYIVTEHGGSGN